MDYYILNTQKLCSTRKAILSSKTKVGTTQKEAQEDLELLDNLAFGNYKNITYPVTLNNVGGKNIGEIIPAVNVSWLLIVNERFKNIVEENNLTGCSFFEVIVKDKFKESILHFGFSITGTCTYADWDKSEIIKKSYGEGLPIINFCKGFYLEKEESFRTDFAFAGGRGFKILSQKAKDILEKAKFKNLEFINYKDFETAENNIRHE